MRPHALYTVAAFTVVKTWLFLFWEYPVFLKFFTQYTTLHYVHYWLTKSIVWTAR